jgi:hypothetical protein
MHPEPNVSVDFLTSRSRWEFSHAFVRSVDRLTTNPTSEGALEIDRRCIGASADHAGGVRCECILAHRPRSDHDSKRSQVGGIQPCYTGNSQQNAGAHSSLFRSWRRHFSISRSCRSASAFLCAALSARIRFAVSSTFASASRISGILSSNDELFVSSHVSSRRSSPGSILNLRIPDPCQSWFSRNQKSFAVRSSAVYSRSRLFMASVIRNSTGCLPRNNRNRHRSGPRSKRPPRSTTAFTIVSKDS